MISHKDLLTKESIIHLTKEDVILSIKTFFMNIRSILSPDMMSDLATIDLWLTHQITVSECRKIAFKVHEKARLAKDLKMVYLYRAIGHAIASIHVKEHALRSMDYMKKYDDLGEYRND